MTAIDTSCQKQYRKYLGANESLLDTSMQSLTKFICYTT